MIEKEAKGRRIPEELMERDKPKAARRNISHQIKSNAKITRKAKGRSIDGNRGEENG